VAFAFAAVHEEHLCGGGCCTANVCLTVDGSLTPYQSILAMAYAYSLHASPGDHQAPTSMHQTITVCCADVHADLT
jgi:hypothetical protein